MSPRSSTKRAVQPTVPSVTRKRSGASGTGRDKYAAIKRDLQKQRTTILEEASGGLTNRAGQEAFPDVSDQASAEVDQHFTMRIKEREQKLLKKIDEALDRMKKKTYGICEGCEEEIPYQRLKARPVTTLCIACKTLQEQEEKFRG